LTEVQAGTGISVADGTGPIPVVTNTVATAFDAKGDLVVGTGADTFAKLTVGTDGHTLVANSSTSTGLEWQAPAGGGKVLQVVYASTTTFSTSSSDVFADTGLTATITPSAATSKVLVLVHQNGFYKTGANTSTAIGAKLLRGVTDLTTFAVELAYTGTAMSLGVATASTAYLDTPNTTSATTYKTQYRSRNNNAAIQVQANGDESTIVLMEIGA
jgi:hypothetical protein